MRIVGVVQASGQIGHSCRSGAPEHRPDGKERVGALKEARLRRDHRIYAGDDPVDETDPSGDAACPAGTRYSGSVAKFTCLSVQTTLGGKKVWIRVGNTRSFGEKHFSQHDLSLQAIEVAIQYRLLPTQRATKIGGQNEESETQYFQSPDGGIINVFVLVEFSPTLGGLSTPDHDQIGVTTAYCQDPRNPATGDCPSWVQKDQFASDRLWLLPFFHSAGWSTTYGQSRTAGIRRSTTSWPAPSCWATAEVLLRHTVRTSCPRSPGTQADRQLDSLAIAGGTNRSNWLTVNVNLLGRNATSIR